jgi:hypothetical protein
VAPPAVLHILQSSQYGSDEEVARLKSTNKSSRIKFKLKKFIRIGDDAGTAVYINDSRAK